MAQTAKKRATRPTHWVVIPGAYVRRTKRSVTIHHRGQDRTFPVSLVKDWETPMKGHRFRIMTGAVKPRDLVNIEIPYWLAQDRGLAI